MGAVNVSPVLAALIQPNAYAQNGQVVGAGVENAMRAAANQVLALRGKEHFRYACPLDAIPGGTSGTRVRWRFAGRTSPSAVRLHVHVIIARGNGVDSLTSHSTFDEEASGGHLEWYYGGTQADDVPSELAEFHGVLDVDPNTDIYGVFKDVALARLVAAVVYEEALAPDTANGYFAPVSVGVNIYDEDREGLAVLANDWWQHGGSHVWNVTADLASSAPSNATTSLQNLLDTSATTVDPSTPGATIDMTGKATLMREPSPGVACVMKAYAHLGGATGKLKLKDSADAVIATVDITETDAEGWYATTLYLPATSDKYDLQFALDSATDEISVEAVSIWEYEHGDAPQDVPDPVPDDPPDPGFVAEVSSITPNPIADLGTLTWSLEMTTTGQAQTGLSVAFDVVYEDNTPAVLSGAPTVTQYDGWTVTSTNLGDGTWTFTMSRASQLAGESSTVIFTANVYKHAHATVGIGISDAHTDQVTGSTTTASVSFS